MELTFCEYVFYKLNEILQKKYILSNQNKQKQFSYLFTKNQLVLVVPDKSICEKNCEMPKYLCHRIREIPSEF